MKFKRDPDERREVGFLEPETFCVRGRERQTENGGPGLPLCLGVNLLSDLVSETQRVSSYCPSPRQRRRNRLRTDVDEKGLRAPPGPSPGPGRRLVKQDERSDVGSWVAPVHLFRVSHHTRHRQWSTQKGEARVGEGTGLSRIGERGDRRWFKIV